MQTIFLFLITFFVMAGSALFINFCKRRVSRTRHGLTGMCHTRGEAMCGCCASKLQQGPASKNEKRPGNHC